MQAWSIVSPSLAVLLFCLPVSLSTTERSGIFLIGHIFHPLDMLAVERLLHRDVHHAGIRPGAVPVLLARRNPHGVARLDLANRTAFGLHAPNTGNDMQRLPQRMRVPRRARAGFETHA